MDAEVELIKEEIIKVLEKKGRTEELDLAAILHHDPDGDLRFALAVSELLRDKKIVKKIVLELAKK